jgi:hypothetical protein
LEYINGKLFAVKLAVKIPTSPSTTFPLGVRNILWWGGGGGGIKLKYFPLSLQNLNLIGYLILPLWERQGRMDGGEERKQNR